MSAQGNRPASVVSRVLTFQAVRLLGQPPFDRGTYQVVVVPWICPTCGGRRGRVELAWARAGQTQVLVHTWTNPCGHQDQPGDVRFEGMAVRNLLPALYEELLELQAQEDLRHDLDGTQRPRGPSGAGDL